MSDTLRALATDYLDYTSMRSETEDDVRRLAQAVLDHLDTRDDALSLLRQIRKDVRSGRGWSSVTLLAKLDAVLEERPC